MSSFYRVSISRLVSDPYAFLIIPVMYGFESITPNIA